MIFIVASSIEPNWRTTGRFLKFKNKKGDDVSAAVVDGIVAAFNLEAVVENDSLPLQERANAFLQAEKTWRVVVATIKQSSTPVPKLWLN